MLTATSERARAAFRAEPMARSFGNILHASEPGQGADALAPYASEFKRMLGSAGVLLLRGFPLDVDGFERFSSLFSDRFYPHHEINDGNREKVSDTVATVNVGGDPFPWHRERGYAPFPPDIIFFYCRHPAREGGETFVTDGCAIMDGLAPATRTFVTQRRVRYTYSFLRETWPVAFSGAETEPQAEAALRALAARLSPEQRLVWKFAPHAVVMQFTTPMLTDTRWEHRPAFCNQVIFQYRINRVTLGNGEAIPAAVVEEADRLGRAASYPVQWQAGDVAVIDNSRVMHARGRITDPERKILARICYADF